jgi:Fibronectin type III domain
MNRTLLGALLAACVAAAVATLALVGGDAATAAPAAGVGGSGSQADHPPMVVKTDVDDVTATGATIQARINPHGSQTSYHVEWGATSAFGSQTPDAQLPRDQGATEVTVTLTGLTPATTYVVRVVAANAAGSAAGDPVTFTTEASQAPGQTPETVTPQGGAPTPVTPSGPQLGSTVVVGRERGRVKVKRPGESTFAAVAPTATVPVGSEIDATQGTLRLTTEAAGGATQHVVLRGARFQVRQRRKARGITDFVLRGGGLERCGRASGATAEAARHRRRPRRSLWARERGGRYRTYGRNAVATVRGTTWVTTDTCAGTTTRVITGTVIVRDLRRHRTVRLHAGQRYLARAR